MKLNGKAKEVADLQAIVKAKYEKLADAQKAQAQSCTGIPEVTTYIVRLS